MANKVLYAPESAVIWTESGGTLVMTLDGLAADGVRVGARRDFGTGSVAGWFHWRFKIDGFDTAPVVNERVEIYLAGSDGTIEDGDVGTADAAGATTDLPNLWHIGGVTVQTTSATKTLHASSKEPIYIASRYVSPVVHNNTADALETTAADHQFILIPVPPEVQ